LSLHFMLIYWLPSVPSLWLWHCLIVHNIYVSNDACRQRQASLNLSEYKRSDALDPLLFVFIIFTATNMYKRFTRN
jgi:hypothetical protein